MEMRINKLVQH